MNTIAINIKKIEHLLKLYRLTREDILLQINHNRKIPIHVDDIFKSEIKFSLLKEIDKIFNKGINYYLDPKEPKESKEESIFFRKDHFNAELTLGAKQRVTQFEEEKISLISLAKLSNLKIDRILPVYKTSDNPKKIANELRKILYPGKKRDIKDFLKLFIANLAEYNIVVFEFVDTHNKREKANINGFFITPNVIVLKRIQKALRREVFTLAHELGHYLLNEEEIDEIYEDFNTKSSLSEIEKWCNDFAYFFLAGEHDEYINSITNINSATEYQESLVQEITKEISLSKIAIYTRLRINKKISQQTYNLIQNKLHQSFLDYEKEKEQRKELDKMLGKKNEGRNSVPIISPFVKKTLQSAYFEGVISEVEFCKRLNIKPENIDRYLQ